MDNIKAYGQTTITSLGKMIGDRLWEPTTKNTSVVMAKIQKQFNETTKVLDQWKQRLKIYGVDYYLKKGSDAAEVLKQKLEKVGNVATYTFAAGTAAVTGFVAAASPDTLNTFTGSFTLLAASIGQTFVPYMAMAAKKIQEVAFWWQSLTSEQQKSITKWTMIGIGISGVIMLLPRLISLGSALLTLLRGVNVVLASISKHPVLWIAGTLASLFAVKYMSRGADSVAASAEDRMVENNKKLSELYVKINTERARWGGAKSKFGLENFSVEEWEAQAKAIQSQMRFDQGKINTDKASNNRGLLFSSNFRSQSFGFGDAYRQMQMAALSQSPLEEELLKIQRNSNLQLQQIAANTSIMADNKPIPAVGD